MLHRRTLISAAPSGFALLAHAALGARDVVAAESPLAPKPPHHAPRASRVIFLCMDGGPSHIDLFDPKPALAKADGKTVNRGRLLGAKLFASPFKAPKRGKSGIEIGETLPHLAAHADKLCVLRGMQTDQPNHPQAFLQMHTGIFQFPRPSLGSWVLYGLGTANANLPGFVSISPPANNGGTANHGSCFLPAVYQGTKLGQAGRPMASARIPNLTPRTASRQDRQKLQLDLIQEFNRQATPTGPTDPAVAGLIDSLELAYRMQGELPGVLDIGPEDAATRMAYGLDEDASRNFGHQCLLARRLVESGVRFVELCQPGWDHHRGIRDALSNSSQAIDKPIAGLLADLDARGLLEDTVVVWGGEFGRTPTSQGGDGRNHNSKGYTMWMAGGGLKAGHVHGSTDELGFEAVTGQMHVHDWHATLLHLLGLDHERLTFRHAGRDMRLTDVKGRVERSILA